MTQELNEPVNRRMPVGAWLVLVASTVVAILLIVPPAVSLAVYGDEIRTWRDSILKTYLEIITWQHSTDHPPLSYLLVKLSVGLFGSEAGWAMRLPSVICGIACVPAAFLLGRCISVRVGLATAAAAAVDLNLVWQSQQARMYSMLLLVAIVAQMAMVRFVRGEKVLQRIHLIAIGAFLGVLLGIGIWLHYSAIALWAGLIAICFGRGRLNVAVPLAIAFVVGLLVCLPGALKLGQMRDREAIQSTHRPEILSQFRVLNKELNGGKVPAYVVPVCAAAGLVLLFRRDPRIAVIFISITVVTLLNTLIAAFFRPVHGARYVTVLQPALWIGLAVLLDEVWDRSPAKWQMPARAMAALAFAGYLAIQLSRSLNPVPLSGTHELANFFREAVRFVKAKQEPGDQVVYAPSTPLGLYGKYYDLNPENSPSPQRPTWIIANVPLPTDSNQSAAKAVSEVGNLYGISLKAVPPAKKDEMEPTRIQIYRLSSSGADAYASTGELLKHWDR